MGNSSGEVGEGARGCRGEGAGDMEGGVGPYGRRRRRGEEEEEEEVGRTDRQMGGEGRLWKKPAELKKTVEEKGEQHGGWFHEREEGVCQRETDTRARTDLSVWAPSWNNLDDVTWNHRVVSIYQLSWAAAKRRNGNFRKMKSWGVMFDSGAQSGWTLRLQV